MQITWQFLLAHNFFCKLSSHHTAPTSSISSERYIPQAPHRQRWTDIKVSANVVTSRRRRTNICHLHCYRCFENKHKEDDHRNPLIHQHEAVLRNTSDRSIASRFTIAYDIEAHRSLMIHWTYPSQSLRFTSRMTQSIFISSVQSPSYASRDLIPPCNRFLQTYNSYSTDALLPPCGVFNTCLLIASVIRNN